jgi:uncharacterized membrane protein
MSKPKSNIQNIKDSIFCKLKALLQLVHKLVNKFDTSIPKKEKVKKVVQKKAKKTVKVVALTKS